MPVIKRSDALDKAIKQAKIDELVAIVDKLDRESKAIVIDAISRDLTETKRLAALNQVKRLLQLAEADIKRWTVNSVSQAYLEGAKLTDEQLRNSKISVNVVTGEMTIEALRTDNTLLIHKDAVNALIADTYLDIANGMNGLVKGVERQLSDASKRQIRAKMIAGQLTGQSIDEVRKEVVDIIGQQGFSTLIDRGGRQWTLKRYSEMVTRHHIIKSGNEGTINRAAEFNVDIVEVSTHGGSCKICTPYEGRKYSLSGQSKQFPKLDLYPPYHPNCRHSLLLRPDLQ